MKKIIALALCALLIVPMTFAVSATDDLKDVTLRWDFNDLNEKNGLVSLVANDQSTANEDMVEFNDGVMSILGHAVDYDFSTPIVLDDAHDWSVEFRAALTDYSILLGSDTKGSLIYLAAGVGQWSNPIRIIPDGLESPIFVDSTNKGISFGDYLDAAYEMNTWRITYNAKDVTVVVEFLNVEAEIKELQEKLLHVVIIEDGASTHDVSMGNTVLVRDVEFGDDMEYRIVGTTEADIASGKISNESPLGKALMGKKVGDVAKVAAPNGAVIEYKILEIK